MSNDKARARHLWNNFRLTPEEWDKILAFQNGVCCVCGRTQKSGKRLATDHSHISGLIRALLCSVCNRLLGRIERAYPKGTNIGDILLRLWDVLNNPPAVKALGREVFGFAGRCGTKRHRAALRKEKKANKMAEKVTKRRI